MTKITLAICTKDRPIDMKSLLTSISKQTRLPDRIIVADGSDNPIKSVVDQFDNLPIEYVTVRPPSLPKQRNVCISKLTSSDEWVGFLDDDLVLEDNCLENLEVYISEQNNLSGVGITINNQANLKRSFIRELFLLDKIPGGIFTKSGCPAAIRPSKTDLELEWVYGGATFWKKEVLQAFKYDEWFDGTGYYEDVDFSFRVSRQQRIALCSSARCFHYHHPVRKERLIALGEWQITGWWYFISKNGSFNKLLVLWSMTGVALINFMIGALKPKSNRLRSFIGNLKGMYRIMTGSALVKKGFNK